MIHNSEVWIAGLRRKRRLRKFLILTCGHIALLSFAPELRHSFASGAEFPRELVDWEPGPANPVFSSRGNGFWDKQIRERGWILHEGDTYRLWYTGYDGTPDGIRQLGYATSPDGVQWTRSAQAPLCPTRWVEDMMVVKCADVYYMFAEGSASGHAELLTSTNGVDWEWRGPLAIRMADGSRDAEMPCGTPTAWVEDGVWYLFYERHDLGVWLARARNPLSRTWINVQDDPVLAPGPSDYDKKLIALDQIIKYDNIYYAFYHACGENTPRTWNTNIAQSHDLIHWQKFANNPLVDDVSSGMVVRHSNAYRLYTMHNQIDVFYSPPSASRIR